MTKSLLFLAFVIVVVVSNFVYHYEVKNTAFLVFGFAAFFINRHYPHIFGLLIIIIVVRLLETMIWLIFAGNSAFIVYPVQIALDVLVLVLLHYRWRIHAALDKNIRLDEIIFTHADYHISQIYKAYALIAALAFVEHIVRHPYSIGLPNEWANPNLMLIYNSLDYSRLALSILQYAIILFAAHRYLSSPRIVRA